LQRSAVGVDAVFYVDALGSWGSKSQGRLLRFGAYLVSEYRDLLNAGIPRRAIFSGRNPERDDPVLIRERVLGVAVVDDEWGAVRVVRDGHAALDPRVQN
jgi:hypothetical protein